MMMMLLLMLMMMNRPIGMKLRLVKLVLSCHDLLDKYSNSQHLNHLLNILNQNQLDGYGVHCPAIVWIK